MSLQVLLFFSLDSPDRHKGKDYFLKLFTLLLLLLTSVAHEFG